MGLRGARGCQRVGVRGQGGDGIGLVRGRRGLVGRCIGLVGGVGREMGARPPTLRWGWPARDNGYRSCRTGIHDFPMARRVGAMRGSAAWLGRRHWVGGIGVGGIGVGGIGSAAFDGLTLDRRRSTASRWVGSVTRGRRQSFSLSFPQSVSRSVAWSFPRSVARSFPRSVARSFSRRRSAGRTGERGGHGIRPEGGS